MDDWEKINGVLYIEWNSTPIDYTSLNLSAWETLVLKNGNLTINDNINDLVWLIITKDDFWDDDIWNIYIESDITDINAWIFADGSLISVKSDWNQFDINDTSRNDELVRQLRIKWALFTKNTIGWAIDDWGEYEKFGWEKTSNYWTALTYDLNLLRSGNLEANWVDVVTVKPEYSVVITYDSWIMNGVLKWFTK